MKRLEFNRENVDKYGMVTRDGKSARVLCWDLISPEETLAVAINDGDREYIETYYANGSFCNDGTEWPQDLLINCYALKSDK